MKSVLIFSIFCSLMGFHFAIAGGISGGGGFVINPEKPSSRQNPEEVEHLIFRSKPLFVRYLSHKYHQYKYSRLSAAERTEFAKLFDNNKGAYQADLEKYDVFVDDRNPCYSADREPVDGSIYSAVPNTFCISSVNLAKKVARSEISRQSAALMVHEFSEIRGLSEEDAVMLQKKALDELKK